MAKKIKGIEDLQHDIRNANKGTQRGRGMVEASLREVGAGRSIVTDREGRVIAGNKTLEAAADIGLGIRVIETDGSELVVVQRNDLDLSDDTGPARKLAYYDNRAGETGLAWDAEVLLADLQSGVDLSGMFDQDELDALLDGLIEKEPMQPAEAQIDKAAELQAKWNTQPGQLWQLGRHRLICGDCTDKATVERLMQGERAKITFTSPPYNLGENVKLSTRDKKQNAYLEDYQDNKSKEDYTDFLCRFMECIRPFADYHFVNLQMLAGNKIALIDFLYQQKQYLADTAIWYKSNPQPAAAKNVMNSAFEFIFIFSCETEPTRAIKTANFHGTFSNVYRGTVNSENIVPELHSAAFPLSMATDFISAFSDGIVLEPFCGTGTTLMACEQLNRQCRAVEISPAYCAVILQRYKDSTGIEPKLIDSYTGTNRQNGK